MIWHIKWQKGNSGIKCFNYLRTKYTCHRNGWDGIVLQITSVMTLVEFMFFPQKRWSDVDEYIVIKLSNNKTHTKQNQQQKRETSNVCFVHEKSGARILADVIFTFFSYRDFKKNYPHPTPTPHTAIFFFYCLSKQEEPNLDFMFLCVSTKDKYIIGINQFQCFSFP